MKERQVWKRPPSPAKWRHSLEHLTPEQEACVKVALRVLGVGYGSLAAVADKIKVPRKTVHRHAGTKCRATAGMAIRVAELADVPVDDVLSGAFPKAGSCTMCGRCG